MNGFEMFLSCCRNSVTKLWHFFRVFLEIVCFQISFLSKSLQFYDDSKKQNLMKSVKDLNYVLQQWFVEMILNHRKKHGCIELFVKLIWNTIQYVNWEVIRIVNSINWISFCLWISLTINHCVPSFFKTL